LRAIEKFEPSRQTSFIAFAKWEIFAEIMAVVGDAGAIRLPQHLAEEMQRAIRDPKLMESFMRPKGPYRAAILSAFYMRRESIHVPDDKNDEAGFLAALRVQAEIAVGDHFNAVAEKEFAEKVRAAIWELVAVGNMLTRDADIVSKFFGLATGIEMPQPKIAEEMGLSRQRIGEMYVRGHAVMQQSAKLRALHALL
jgi:DNA-directed RNA polymerase sigma subunit (sigma70/sigma32)